MSLDERVTHSCADHQETGLSREDLHALYYYMQLTRSVENKVRALYLQGALQGAVYTSTGQEGTAVGSAYALAPQDYCAPLIRDLGASFVRGIEPRVVFDQWLGRVGSPTGGRDGNLHFGDLSHGVLAPISMLGATIPLCAGVALSSVQQGGNRVALAYIGDGGSNTGEFHEGMNFAATLHLPLVLILEDNGFAYSTPTHRHVAVGTLADRAVAYGIPSCTIDGNDVIAVYRQTREAVDRARSGRGPTLIEVKTFRMRGHAEHDDAFYVPRELLETWRDRDPIDRLVRYMEERSLMTSGEKANIDERIANEVTEAADQALADPLPDATTQGEGVYAPS